MIFGFGFCRESKCSELLKCQGIRYQMEPLEVTDNLLGGVRNFQKDLKVILKGDMSLDGPHSR